MSFKITVIVTIFHFWFFLFSKYSNKSLLIKEYFYFNTFHKINGMLQNKAKNVMLPRNG
jgi:hypothetical protein